jgi:tRNA-dihydrouridine synthase
MDALRLAITNGNLKEENEKLKQEKKQLVNNTIEQCAFICDKYVNDELDLCNETTDMEEYYNHNARALAYMRAARSIRDTKKEMNG